MGKNILSEVAVEVESTADLLEATETVDLLQLGVVGNLETTLDGGEFREGDVGQLGVGDERKGSSNAGQVGSGEVFEGVAVEAERAVKGGKRWQRDGRAVVKRHVESPDQVGEGDLEAASVALKSQSSRDIAELGLNLVEEGVVGNSESVNNLQVNAVEGVKLGVLDVDGAGLLDAGSESELLEIGQRVPDDGIDNGETGEAQRRQDLNVIELEVTRDLLEAGSTEGGELGDVVGNEVTIELLDTAQRDGIGGAGCNGNATGVCLARCEGSCITGILDGGGGGNAAASSCLMTTRIG